MSQVAKTDHAEVLTSIKKRLIAIIGPLNEHNTRFDDDPMQFNVGNQKQERLACIITLDNSRIKDQFNASTCDIRVNTAVVVSLMMREHSDPKKEIDAELVTSETSFYRYWFKSIVGALIHETDQSTKSFWMPKKGDKNLLVEPMQPIELVNPKRGNGWMLSGQVAFSLSFQWDV